MSAAPSRVQHCLNPLHLYCRLRDLGLPEAAARRLSGGYERALYRPLAAAAETRGRRKAACAARGS